MKKRLSKAERFPEGYLPKLRYWGGKVVEYLTEEDPRLSYAIDRYLGFLESHEERYPEIPVELDFVTIK
jgi:hypothetical protein